MNRNEGPVIWIEMDDGDEVAISKREIMAETSVEELRSLFADVQGVADDISIMFKAFADLNQCDQRMATKLGCYRQAQGWIKKRLGELGGLETDDQHQINQARQITQLLKSNEKLRERLAELERAK